MYMAYMVHFWWYNIVKLHVVFSLTGSAISLYTLFKSHCFYFISICSNKQHKRKLLSPYAIDLHWKFIEPKYAKSWNPPHHQTGQGNCWWRSFYTFYIFNDVVGESGLSYPLGLILIPIPLDFIQSLWQRREFFGIVSWHFNNIIFMVEYHNFFIYILLNFIINFLHPAIKFGRCMVWNRMYLCKAPVAISMSSCQGVLCKECLLCLSGIDVCYNNGKDWMVTWSSMMMTCFTIDRWFERNCYLKIWNPELDVSDIPES